MPDTYWSNTKIYSNCHFFFGISILALFIAKWKPQGVSSSMVTLCPFILRLAYLAKTYNFIFLDSRWVHQMWKMDTWWYRWQKRIQDNFMAKEVYRACEETSNDLAIPFCRRQAVCSYNTSWSWRFPHICWWPPCDIFPLSTSMFFTDVNPASLLLWYLEETLIGKGNHFQGFTLEDATGLYVKGDVDVHSVYGTALPMSHPSFSLQQVLEMSDKWRSQPLPRDPVYLFIGILSASNHFAERMAVRKTWMQSSEIRSSKVVARFFVALVSKLCIQTKSYLRQKCLCPLSVQCIFRFSY
jgi:hypothetical protein